MKIINRKLQVLYTTRVIISIIFLLLFAVYIFNASYDYLWMLFVPLGISLGIIGYFEKCPGCKKSLLFHVPGEKISFGIREKCPYCKLTLKK